MNKLIKFIIKLSISVVFLLWIVYRVNWQEVLILLGQINVKYIILYFTILVIGIAVSAHKWGILAKFKGINLPLRVFFKFYLAGTFVNNFMPSFIGGDAFRAYQIGKIEKKYTEAASSVVMDRLTGLFGAMILTLFFSLINFNAISANYTLITLNTGVMLSLLVIGLFFATRKMLFWQKIISSKLKIGKYMPEKILKFIAEMTHYHNNTGVLWQAVMWSMAFSMIGLAAANFMLFLALGVQINILDYLSVIFLISFISALPISINNIGVKEWAYVTFFGFFGVSATVVITVAILSRFLQMLLSFFALPVYLGTKK